MLKQRVFTAFIALGVLLAVLFVVPASIAEAVIALLVIGAAWEWSGLLSNPGRTKRTAFIILIVLLLGVAAALNKDVVTLILQAAMAWWLVAFIWTVFYPTPIPDLLRWVCGVLVLIPLYLAIIELYRAGPLVLLFALIIVWAADIGAYFTGRSFGRVKLAPAVSPGKTWEGVIGGLILVMLLSTATSFAVEPDLATLVPFCTAVAAVSIIGDLTVSMFKRSAGVKDSGTLFPGHGGVLDRVDSVAAAAPLFVLGGNWLGLFR